MSVVAPEKKSTHKVEIVAVELRAHPAADLLSVIPIFGYTYVGRTADWVGVKRGAYIPPDSLVDVTRPEFAFLADKAKSDGKARIKAMKLRGVVSFGLMVPVPDDTPLGEDWAERLGVEHYEPPLPGEARAKGYFLGGDDERQPAVHAPTYDLDAFRRYHHLFTPGEPVIVTEKLDGANARFTFHDGRMYCGSRTRWTKEFSDYSHLTVEFLTNQGVAADRAEAIIAGVKDKPQKRNVWWQALRALPELEAFCMAHPNTIVYGEVYGETNAIKYGFGGNRFAAFDVMRGGRWLNPEDAFRLMDEWGVPTVPILNPSLEVMPPIIEPIPYDFDRLCEMAEGETCVPSAKPGTIREGVVVSPITEREDMRLGRVKLKIVSASYLEKHR